MKKMNKFDLCFIGAGPATVTALFRLIEKGYGGKIAVIEKGKRIEARPTTEVINGFGGAGTYSDGKLSSSLNVGGNIPNLSSKDLHKFEKYILEMYNHFLGENEKLAWQQTTSFDTTPSNLTWDSHKTCHMGTERTRGLFLKLEEFFEHCLNIYFLFEKEVKDVFELTSGEYEVVLDKEPTWLVADKVILATGQKNLLPSILINKFDLKSTPRAFQIGVRVEDTINEQYQNIIKANYDFKFVKEYNYDNGVKVRVRTFCCNSGNAHTCAEKASEGFTCFNGHALKEPDPNNHTVNYGIMCEVEGLENYNTKEEQIELMKKVNSLTSWEYDNFDEEGNTNPKRLLLGGFKHLIGLYPDEVIKSMTDFVWELNKVVDLSNAHYLYPETKLSGNIPELNYSTFETKQPNLYMIGDCAISRGIVKSSYTGWKFAEELNG